MKTVALWAAGLGITGMVGLLVYAWWTSCTYQCEHPEAGDE
jgi:hypothetical protein